MTLAIGMQQVRLEICTRPVLTNACTGCCGCGSLSQQPAHAFAALACFVTMLCKPVRRILARPSSNACILYFAVCRPVACNLGTMIDYWFRAASGRRDAMSKRGLRLGWFACLPLVLFAIGGDQANAQRLVSAKSLSVDGPVEIRRSPTSAAALKTITSKLHDQLKAGDRIVTGWYGRIVLGLTDGSLAVVGEQTVVEIKDLGSSPRELFYVLRG